MDLLNSNESHPKPEGEGQGEERKEEDGDVLSPLQSGPPPLGSSDVTTPTSGAPGPPAPLNPMSSVVNMKTIMYNCDCCRSTTFTCMKSLVHFKVKKFLKYIYTVVFARLDYMINHSSRRSTYW